MSHSSLILNEDNCHFFFTRSAEDMTLDGLHALVDQYAGTQVSRLVFNVNAMRTSYRSAVWESVWDDAHLDRRTGVDGKFRRWIDNARLLHERGLDPYAVWIARCREKEIEPWVSMRMNDAHFTEDPDHWLHSTFWRERPQWRRMGGRGFGGFDQQLDYARPEVREHHLALVRELLQRYDPDGIELDWMRWPYHFKPGHEQEGGRCLDEFMLRVRRLVEARSAKRGHPINVSVRVPATPEAARGLGLDAVAWARRGLIDVLVPAPFHSTANFDIPVERWRELIDEAEPRCEIAAGLTTALRASPELPGLRNEITSVRGFAWSALGRGADRVYLFNYMDADTTLGGAAEDYPVMLRQCGQLATLQNKPRRHVVTYNDTEAPGVPIHTALPALLGDARRARFRINTGPTPAPNERVLVCFGLARGNGVESRHLSGRVNDAATGSVTIGPQDDVPPGAHAHMWFEASPGQFFEGYNVVELGHEIAETSPLEVVWCEVKVDSP